MTPKHGPKEIRERRKDRVAYWRLRGLSIRKIAAKLEEEGVIDHKKERPFTHTTIANDLKSLSTQWQQKAAQAIAAHKANQLAEIQEARAVAWSRVQVTKEGDIYSSEDIGEIRRLLELEAKLLGTFAPAQSVIGGMDDNPLIIKGYTNVSPDDWDSEGGE